jgi:hypothetical protein
MKKLLLLFAAAGVPVLASAQCSTTNATSCQCETSSQSDCDLLPDIMVSEYAYQTYQGGPNEYPQTNAGTSVTGQGPDDGRLRLSGSTPNVGRGPMEVRAVDQNGYRWFLCGTDTFSVYDPNGTVQFTCPNSDPNPHQLLKQRVYHKTGNAMTYYERFAGSMTYHPSHGHYHVDDWEIMTLRIQDPNEPNPLRWPIVGTGNKVGFCIEDFQSCSTANGHCRDSSNNILTNTNITNFGLGGGNYGCGNIFQGITVGYTDIYWETLDGQWINIDPGTCNGQYYVVVEVDPHNFFLESNESNNWFATPITLTQQQPSGNPVIEITADKQSTTLCQGDSLTLTATAGSSILWSNGATTQKIRVPSASATYSVVVTNYCGTGTASYTVSEVPAPPAPVAAGDTICAAEMTTLTAAGSGTLKWYDAYGNQVGSGSTFNTPTLSSTTTYYVENSTTHADTSFSTPYTNSNGAGDWKQSTQYEIFNAYTPFTLISVKVYAQGAGNRTIELQDATGAMIQTATVNIPAGVSTVTLNFNVPAGNGYRLAGLATTGSLNMYRNNSANISYPYGVPGILDITGSSGGASYYYYFYDWKVAAAAASCGTKVPVTVVVSPCTGISENATFKTSLNVFPNPSNGNFNISFNAPHQDNISIELFDMVGKKMIEKQLGNFQGEYKGEITAKGLSKGIYMLSIKYEGKPYYTKLIIQ